MLQKTSPLAYSKQAPTLLPNRQTPGEQLFSSARKPAASLARKEQMTSYPGELLDLDHQTISLRTQLRLSYETYAWLRYLTWGGLALAGVLLLVLPGGFPPRAFLHIWQTVPLLGRLLHLHGASALFSFVLLSAQALTWFVLWGLWGFACHSLARYTWRLYRTQSFLASAWLPSTPREKRQEHDESTPGALPSIVPGADRQRAQGALLHSRKIDSSVNGAPALAHALSSTTPGAGQATHARGAAPFMGFPENANAAPALAPAMATPAISSTAPGAQTRQFAQPTMPLTRPRIHTSPGEISFGWPFSSGSSAPGVAWDVGIKRKGRPNEDSVLTLRGTCNVAEKLQPFELHIVADGMGGHENGRLASHLAIRSMLETVVPGLVSCTSIESEGIIDILIDGVHWANQVIYQYGQEQKTDLGTTITAVLLLSETAYIINVGDSRTYVYRPGVGLTQITRDHSLVARLVETGAIAPDEIYTHPDRNKVYRGLGDKIDVTVDWFVLPVQAGDLLLLCSDGLWEMVRDPQIADILQTYANSPALASSTLLRAALQAGGSDNVGLLVVRVQP